MVVRTFLIVLLFSYRISTEPIELTDKTWKTMSTGHWMVEFYAPWCSACQKLQPVWNDFSKAMSSKTVKVASVNIDQYSSLANRFRITALPTVYYVRDGVFRQYDGERSLASLKNYIIHEDWQKTEPISSYLAPNGILMSLAGFTFDFPSLVKDIFILLQDQYGLPRWLIYTVLAVAVTSFGIASGFGVMSLINNLVVGISGYFKKPVLLDEGDRKQLLNSNEPTIATSVSQVTTTRDEKNSLDGDSKTSHVEEATDEEKNQPIHQCLLEK